MAKQYKTKPQPRAKKAVAASSPQRPFVLTWDGNFPVVVRIEVEPILAELEWLMPKWVQRLNLVWSPNQDDGASASVNVNYEYRFMTIFIHGNWLDMPQTKCQFIDILHETIHGSNVPLVKYVKEEFSRLLEADAPKYCESVLVRITELMESQTQDLMWAIVNKFYADKM